ncbi:MAG TPA: hypothetical protein VKG22_00410 [Stellaceae bacterium]|nr:hypothetical protein [Stellaceae bacterium]
MRLHTFANLCNEVLAKPPLNPNCRATSSSWILFSDSFEALKASTRYGSKSAAFNIGDMLEAYDALRAHAPSPHHIIPGHDPLVMRLYPAPRPELEGVLVRLDVMPKS